MIRMSHIKLRALIAAAGLAATLAGCCGGAPSHKCDFTPYSSQSDGGTDGPMPCGTAVCATGQICCLKTIAPYAFCIAPQDFVNDGCEMMTTSEPPSCLVPQDCDGGVCCVELSQGTTVCEPSAACMVDGRTTWLACGTDRDCPGQLSGSCAAFPGTSVDGSAPLYVCAP